MGEPRTQDIRQAFLKSLNESEARYLLVGDMAWNRHGAIRESATAEAWVDPSTHAFDVAYMYTRAFQIVREQYPNTEASDLALRVKDEIKIHREQPPLNFETSYAERVPWTRHGQPTFVLSADHLVTREMESPDQDKRDQANKLLEFIQAKELGRSQTPERGPDDDPGHKPKRPRDQDKGHERD